MSAVTSLWAGGRSVTIRAPDDFDLLDALRRAHVIRLATAFAHRSGWRLISPAIAQSNAELRLLTGLSFCQTEPYVLKAWLRVVEGTAGAAKVSRLPGITFHPKVLVVEGDSSFAIVGSGNLSAGGLRDNIECSVYLNAPADIKALSQWFDAVFDDSYSLTTEVIRSYEPLFENARSHLSKAREEERAVKGFIQPSCTATMKDWNKAVEKAKQVFLTPGFAKHHRDHQREVPKFKKALCYPKFNFSRDGFDEFYRILNLGHLVPVHKEKVWKKRERLQKGLCHLVDEAVPVADRVDALTIQDSQLRVPFFGINAISKVLAIHRPRSWPVWNGVVREALASFGYVAPRRCSIGQKYSAFAALMLKFQQETEAADMLALDAFFWSCVKKA